MRAKAIDNGCTEDEALSAAAKVAELLDRYDLSLTDVEMREAPSERLEYETWRKSAFQSTAWSVRWRISAIAV